MSDPTANTAPTHDTGRATNGRFAKGNSGGPGNPFARKVAALRAALLDTVTEQDIKDIAAKLRDDAKNGDQAAIKLLFQYVIGKPQPAVDPDTLDVQEMRGYQAASFPPELLAEMQRALPLPLLLKLWPFFVAAQEQHTAAQLGEQWDEREEQERRRQERAHEKATRKQRRREARQQASPPQPKPTASPSPNGHNGDNGFAHAETAPSPNGDLGEHTLTMILNWLRRQREPSNGDAQA